MSHWDRFDHEARHDHRFERGDLRYVILDLLGERPSHGYELIHALEERFHGFYAPSPGTIYPTLQWLEDLGYVTVAEEDGRKIYTITEEGRRHLADGSTRVDRIWERTRGWFGPLDKREYRDEMHNLLRELQEIGRTIRQEARALNSDKLRRVREVATRASREIQDILREPEPRKENGQTAAGSASQEGHG
jgi:DNA-binding PadR family transcriptional regulator